ncbi:MAG: SPOR domain-containing protein [Alphaproteobacteria bacterium]|nr:SPOR domain-containing protein [Alphaproteobacteria bacterium]
MEQEDNLDLLDLEQESEVDTLPEATPFSSPRPKKPWLLMGLGVAVIVLSTWIIIAHVGGDSSSVVTVDLDAPVAVDANAPVADLNVPAKPVEPAKVEQPKQEVKAEAKPAVAPVVKPVESDGNPIRVVQDRKEVTFDPDKAPVAAKPVAKKAPVKAAVKPQPKAVATANGSIYVQFGSYSTRELAQAAEKKLRNSHSGLFSGKQFVILAAQVKGQTTYRLRVPFHSANDANGFCRNAKSDGLDCYVTK